MKSLAEWVKGLIRGYVALFRLSWSEMLQYRASVFLWTLWSLSGPIIHLAVWSAIIEAEGALGGYDRGSIVAYFLVQSIVYHFTVAWQAYEFSYLIRTGTLSVQLLRPFDPSHYIVANNVAFKLINLVWLIPIWTGMMLYFRPQIELSWERGIGFVVSMTLAAVLYFLWVHCWAMLAFWTVRASAFFEFTDVIGYLIGGGIAPIALLPGGLRTLALYFPQYYWNGFPVEVAIGTVEPGSILSGMGITVVWIIVLFLVYRLLWRRGLRRFGAVGA